VERALDLNIRGVLELVARYQTAGAVRAGRKRIAVYLRNRGVKQSYR